MFFSFAFICLLLLLQYNFFVFVALVHLIFARLRIIFASKQSWSCKKLCSSTECCACFSMQHLHTICESNDVPKFIVSINSYLPVFFLFFKSFAKNSWLFFHHQPLEYVFFRLMCICSVFCRSIFISLSFCFAHLTLDRKSDRYRHCTQTI